MPADDPPSALALCALLEPELLRAAAADGRRVRLLSLVLDIAPGADAGPWTASARVERATRTLVFATAEARSGTALAAAAQAVFRVDSATNSAA